jgi:hypothetical protein
MITTATGVTIGSYNFQLEEGGYVSGRVVDTNQNPIAGLTMATFTDQCGVIWTAWTATDKNDHYQIGPVAPDAYYIFACTTLR